MKDIWAKKSLSNLLAESAENSNGLKRTLGRWNLIALGIGGIIGAGIFVLTGQAAASYAGPAVVLSFVVAGIACTFAGLCYAEFASMIPIAGSAYTYAYATMGEFLAWVIGWDLILEYLFAASTVSVGWSGYTSSFLHDIGIHLPSYFTNAPIAYDTSTHEWSTTGSIINLPAVFIIFMLTMLLIVGIKESAKLNNIVVIIKLTVIFLFLAFGVTYVITDNWTPFIPVNTGNFGQFGWSGIFRAAGVIFFAYIGFDAVSTAAQESKNPQKDMPWGILGSLVICTLIYIMVGLVMTGMVKYDLLNDPAPVAIAVNTAGEGLAWLKPFIKIGAIAGLSSVILVMLLAQSRIFFTMSKDGLLPPLFSVLHTKFKTPYITSIIVGSVASAIAGAFPIGLLGELVSIGTLLAFVIVCGGVLVLRYRSPELERPFKTPFFPYVPILGVLSSFGVMLTLPGDTWLRLVVWMLLGIVIYFAYSNRNSVLNKATNKL